MRGERYGIIVLLRANPQRLCANFFQNFDECCNARFGGGRHGDRLTFCDQGVRVSMKKFWVRGGNSRKFLSCHRMAAKKYRARIAKLRSRFFHNSQFCAARVSDQSGCRDVTCDFRKQIERYANGKREVHEIGFCKRRSQVPGKSFVERAANLGVAHNFRTVPASEVDVRKMFAQRESE